MFNRRSFIKKMGIIGVGVPLINSQHFLSENELFKENEKKLKVLGFNFTW